MRMSRHIRKSLLATLALVSLCPAFPMYAVRGAVPPPPRDIQEVRAVLAQAPMPPAGELRPLKIVLAANRKDHGPHEHDYPRWMERWSVFLGGPRPGGPLRGQAAGAAPVNLYGPAADLSQGPPPGAANVTVETARDWPSAEQFASADLVVVFIGTGGFWNEARLRDVKALLDRGGGFVAVHSTIIAEQPTARPLAESIGLAWESGYTLFRHGPVDLKIVVPEHPICKGLPQQIHFEDETYWPLVGDASRIDLLATADEKAKDSDQLRPEPMFWTLAVGRGRVYSCVLGHYTWTFDDPYFRILLLRGMAWAAGESPYRFDPLVLCGARTSDQKRAPAATLADAAPVAPDSGDPNLLLWLDASDRTTLTVDDDGRVSAWSSVGANDHLPVLTSSAAQRPLYVAKALGGRAALRFDGVDDVLRDTALGKSAQAWTVVLVATPRSNAGSGQFRALLATNRPGQNDYQTGLNLDLGPGETPQFSVLNLEGVKDAPGATNLRTETAPFGEGQILILSTGGGRSRLWINGIEEEGRSANDAITAMDELRIGGRFYVNQERGFFHGDVSEVLIYRTALTDLHRGGLYAHLLGKYGPDIKPPVAYSLDAWDYLPAYDWGSTRRPLESIDEAIRSSHTDKQARATLESRLIQVLADPSSTPAAKDFVCRRLAIIGSAAGVPALADLLSDETLSNMACFALERIPDSAADEALCQALGRVPANLRIGVIHALGSRNSRLAVDPLIRLLGDQDTAIRQAAAGALGKIGGPVAAEALRTALDKSPLLERVTFADSCLKCAEQFSAAGKQAEALAIYEGLSKQDVPQTVRVAALRGTIAVRGAGRGVPASQTDR